MRWPLIIAAVLLSACATSSKNHESVDRDDSGAVLKYYNAMDYGATGDGSTGDLDEIQNTIDAAQLDGRGVVYLPPKVYNCESGVLSVTGSNIAIIGYGAQLLNARIDMGSGASNLSIIGVHLLDNTSSVNTYHLNISGTRFLLQDVMLEKSPNAGGYQAYLRQGSSFGMIRGLRTKGSNGIYIAGHDHDFMGCQLEAAGGDDAYVIKGGSSAGGFATYNITISGGSVRNHTSILSVGSEIGEYATDGDYTDLVRNVSVTGVAAYNCSHLVFIKPGALSADYRHGLVENIVVDSCTLLDPAGSLFNMGVRIWAGRGALVRNVLISNCQITARCDATPVTRCGVEITVKNLGAAATIQDVEIRNLSVVDSYSGVASGIGSAVGNPIDWGASIELENTAVGTIGRILMDGLHVHGTRTGGLYMGAGIAGPIILESPVFHSIAVSPPSSVGGGVYSSSPVSIHNADIESLSLRPIGASGLTSTVYDSEVATAYFGTVAAGSTAQRPIWSAPADCYVWKVEVVNHATVTQNNTDYLTLTLRNMASNTILAANTQATGGIAIAADSPVSLLSSTITDSDAYMTAGSVLRLDKTNGGAGRATDEMMVRIHYVRY